MASKLGQMMGMMGGQSQGVDSNPMAMIMQMMSGGMNPQTMMNTIIKQNPQLADVWQKAQQMSKGKTPQEMESMVKDLCGQKGVDFEQAMGMLNQFKK